MLCQIPYLKYVMGTGLKYPTSFLRFNELVNYVNIYIVFFRFPEIFFIVDFTNKWASNSRLTVRLETKFILRTTEFQ